MKTQFTKAEDAMLINALKIYGIDGEFNKRFPKDKKKIQWKFIQARFLPTKTIQQLKIKVKNMKARSGQTIASTDSNNLKYNDVKEGDWPRVPKLSANQEQILISEVRKKGRNWSSIQKTFPRLTAKQLNKAYEKLVTPSKAEMEAQMLRFRKEKERKMLGIPVSSNPHPPHSLPHRRGILTTNPASYSSATAAARARARPNHDPTIPISISVPAQVPQRIIMPQSMPISQPMSLFQLTPTSDPTTHISQPMQLSRQKMSSSSPQSLLLQLPIVNAVFSSQTPPGPIAGPAQTEMVHHHHIHHQTAIPTLTAQPATPVWSMSANQTATAKSSVLLLSRGDGLSAAEFSMPATPEFCRDGEERVEERERETDLSHSLIPRGIPMAKDVVTHRESSQIYYHHRDNTAQLSDKQQKSIVAPELSRGTYGALLGRNGTPSRKKKTSRANRTYIAAKDISQNTWGHILGKTGTPDRTPKPNSSRVSLSPRKGSFEHFSTLMPSQAKGTVNTAAFVSVGPPIMSSKVTSATQGKNTSSLFTLLDNKQTSRNSVTKSQTSTNHAPEKNTSQSKEKLAFHISISPARARTDNQTLPTKPRQAQATPERKMISLNLTPCRNDNDINAVGTHTPTTRKRARTTSATLLSPSPSSRISGEESKLLTMLHSPARVDKKQSKDRGNNLDFLFGNSKSGMIFAQGNSLHSNSKTSNISQEQEIDADLLKFNSTSNHLTNQAFFPIVNANSRMSTGSNSIGSDSSNLFKLMPKKVTVTDEVCGGKELLRYSKMLDDSDEEGGSDGQAGEDIVPEQKEASNNNTKTKRRRPNPNKKNQDSKNSKNKTKKIVRQKRATKKGKVGTIDVDTNKTHRKNILGSSSSSKKTPVGGRKKRGTASASASKGGRLSPLIRVAESELSRDSLVLSDNNDSEKISKIKPRSSIAILDSNSRSCARRSPFQAIMGDSQGGVTSSTGVWGKIHTNNSRSGDTPLDSLKGSSGMDFMQHNMSINKEDSGLLENSNSLPTTDAVADLFGDSNSQPLNSSSQLKPVDVVVVATSTSLQNKVSIVVPEPAAGEPRNECLPTKNNRKFANDQIEQKKKAEIARDKLLLKLSKKYGTSAHYWPHNMVVINKIICFASHCVLYMLLN